MTAEEHLLTDEQLARVAAVVQERPRPWAVFTSTRLPSPVGESRSPE
ncbi:hypothetical protein ACFXOI_05770 [Streptomyces bacillaris]